MSNYLPEDFTISDWADLEPLYSELQRREINNKSELLQWISDRDEFESTISEEMAWRYIKYTCDTEDKSITDSYLRFVNDIQPKISPASHALNLKLLESPFLNEIDLPGFQIYRRSLENEVELFREENIPLHTQEQELNHRYSQIQAAMSIEHEGESITLQQAAIYLKSSNRALRKEIYDKIVERRGQDREELDSILSQLITLRSQIARNAGFDNYRDYKFRALGRFDYTNDDVIKFHESIRELIVPLAAEQHKQKEEELGISPLKPYDASAEPEGRSILKAYESPDELVAKTIGIFGKLGSELAEYLNDMKENGLLDLETRKGKAPGGYNYPLDRTGKPFIFMNASGKPRDMVTMMHEGGHAVHTYRSAKQPLNIFRHVPSEFSEVASMAMELLSMEHWDEFYNNPEDLKRAVKEQLEGIIDSLAWIATVDKFQQWLYLNPGHTTEERHASWKQIYFEFHRDDTDWSGYESGLATMYQRQLHIYEVPFYYIEYGFAQIGALAVWKRFLEDRKIGLDAYLEALSQGYTLSIPELYAKAGAAFDFSKDNIQSLANFLKDQLHKRAN